MNVSPLFAVAVPVEPAAVHSAVDFNCGDSETVDPLVAADWPGPG